MLGICMLKVLRFYSNGLHKKVQVKFIVSSECNYPCYIYLLWMDTAALSLQFSFRGLHEQYTYFTSHIDASLLDCLLWTEMGNFFGNVSAQANTNEDGHLYPSSIGYPV